MGTSRERVEVFTDKVGNELDLLRACFQGTGNFTEMMLTELGKITFNHFPCHRGNFHALFQTFHLGKHCFSRIGRTNTHRVAAFEQFNNFLNFTRQAMMITGNFDRRDRKKTIFIQVIEDVGSNQAIFNLQIRSSLLENISRQIDHFGCERLIWNFAGTCATACIEIFPGRDKNNWIVRVVRGRLTADRAWTRRGKYTLAHWAAAFFDKFECGIVCQL